MKKSLLAVLLLWSAAATAQLDSGYYLGVGIGQLDYQDDGFGLDIDESTNASKLYGGFRFDDTWALEASYGEFGDIDWSLSAFDPNVGTLSLDLTAGWSLLEVRGIAHIRAFYVGAGYWDADIDFDFTLTEPGMVTTGAFSDSDSGYSLIFGGEWEFDDWAVRAEYEYFDTDSGVDLSLIGIGAHFKF